MSASRKRPAVAYAVARAFTVVLTSVIWSVLLALVGFVFAGLITDGVLSASAAAYLMAAIFVFVPLFAAQGVQVGMIEGLAKGDFLLPPGLDGAGGTTSGGPPARQGTGNPWTTGVRWALALGAPAALTAYLAAPALWPSGLTRGSFVLLLVCCGALLAAVTAYFVCGRRFLREALVPLGQRRWNGSRREYLLLRHALPNGLANAVINALVAFVVFPRPTLDPATTMGAEMVVGDTLITLLILTGAVTAGARGHARSDLRWGVVAAEPQGSAPGMGGQVLRLLGVSLALTVGQATVFYLGGIASCSLYQFAAWRAVAFGLYPAFVAYRVAGWAAGSFRPEVEATGGA